MEDIEDLLVGGSGAPPGFRLPLNAVGVNTRKKNNIKTIPTKISQMNGPLTPLLPPKIPGTEVLSDFLI